jgi:hypothetical protein
MHQERNLGYKNVQNTVIITDMIALESLRTHFALRYARFARCAARSCTRARRKGFWCNHKSKINVFLYLYFEFSLRILEIIKTTMENNSLFGKSPCVRTEDPFGRLIFSSIATERGTNGNCWPADPCYEGVRKL